MNPPADRVLNLPVSAFLDGLGERTPTPGGGSVTALTGALACALGRMVAAYSKPEEEPPVAGLHEQLLRADDMLRTLAAEDIAAYQNLQEAWRLARAAPEAETEKQQALAAAAMVPLEIAATADTALDTLARLRPLASRHLLSDLGVAAVLARACVEAARYLVRVNAQAMDDADKGRELSTEADRLAGRAARLAESIESSVLQSLK